MEGTPAVLTHRATKVAGLAAALALPLALTACSGGTTAAAPAMSSAPSLSVSSPMTSPSMTTSSMSAQPFVAGCASLPMTGKGSFDRMSQDPAAMPAIINTGDEDKRASARLIETQRAWSCAS
jgi:hypothetical protein